MRAVILEPDGHRRLVVGSPSLIKETCADSEHKGGKVLDAGPDWCEQSHLNGEWIVNQMAGPEI